MGEASVAGRRQEEWSPEACRVVHEGHQPSGPGLASQEARSQDDTWRLDANTPSDAHREELERGEGLRRQGQEGKPNEG